MIERSIPMSRGTEIAYYPYPKKIIIVISYLQMAEVETLFLKFLC
jgi:hypothetical protein